MVNDFTPFYARVGDTWTLSDYAKKAEEWMAPAPARLMRPT